MGPLLVDAESASYNIAFNLSGSVSIDFGYVDVDDSDEIMIQKVGADMFTAIFTLE